MFRKIGIEKKKSRIEIFQILLNVEESLILNTKILNFWYFTLRPQLQNYMVLICKKKIKFTAFVLQYFILFAEEKSYMLKLFLHL